MFPQVTIKVNLLEKILSKILKFDNSVFFNAEACNKFLVKNFAQDHQSGLRRYFENNDGGLRKGGKMVSGRNSARARSASSARRVRSSLLKTMVFKENPQGRRRFPSDETGRSLETPLIGTVLHCERRVRSVVRPSSSSTIFFLFGQTSVERDGLKAFHNSSDSFRANESRTFSSPIRRQPKTGGSSPAVSVLFLLLDIGSRGGTSRTGRFVEALGIAPRAHAGHARPDDDPSRCAGRCSSLRILMRNANGTRSLKARSGF